MSIRSSIVTTMTDDAIPDYWLPRPELELSDEVRLELNRLYTQHIESGQGDWLSAPLPVPKWAFLNWLADEKGVLLHGSGNPDIATFEPRTPFDKSPDDFSKQTAVFASSDGIWAIIYAVLDRVNFRLGFLNSAVQFETPDGWSQMRYFFSVTAAALAQSPWRNGTVYALPPEGFERQPLSYVLGDRRVLEPHWANTKLVTPLAKLAVTPEDFPLLVQVRGHDGDEITLRAARDPYGFPWLE